MTQRRKNQMGAGLALATLMASALACASAPRIPVLTNKTFTLPSFTLVQPQESLQKQGELSLSIVPLNYEIQEVGETRTARQAGYLKLDGKYAYECVSEPIMAVRPATASFKVVVNNQMNHVFRFAGTVVTYQIDGRQVDVPGEEYEKLLGGIVTPRSRWERVLGGPDLSLLGNRECTIVISFFDVVIETDEASNPTKRATFEWIFQHKPRPKSIPVSSRSQRLYMTAAEVEQWEAGQ